MLLSGFSTAEAADIRDFDLYGGQQVRDYVWEGTLPVFQRDRPISADDPLNADGVPADAELCYRYGLVFDSVDQISDYFDSPATQEDAAPKEDPSLLVGGNGTSSDGHALDNDGNTFARILPYASLITSGLSSYNHTLFEYTFYTDDFGYNEFPLYDHPNVTVSGVNTQVTRYQQMWMYTMDSVVTGEPYLRNWTGVVYTGGIRKTVRDEDGNLSMTVVQNENGGDALFSSRMKDVVIDKDGKKYDLLLTFTRITFVSEEDVSGPLQILEANTLFLAPVLYEDGHYLLDGSEGRDAEGVRIGARFEFEYRIEDEDGNLPEGFLLFLIRDLDSPSMAGILRTDACWTEKDVSQDYSWAEGFGFVRGAACFAVTPYYNHSFPASGSGNPTGLPAQLFVSRMEGVPADGTANGLMFSSSNTVRITDEDARNDSNTSDTGFATLLEPEGAMVATMSADCQNPVEMTLFHTGLSCSIWQNVKGRGSVYSTDYSLADGCLTENRDGLKVVARGNSSAHVIEAGEGRRLAELIVDGNTVPLEELEWVELEDGSAQAVFSGKGSDRMEGTGKTYVFTRDREGRILLRFDNVNSNHSIKARFVFGPFYIAHLIVGSRKPLIILAASLFALVFFGTLFWMARKPKKKRHDA